MHITLQLSKSTFIKSPSLRELNSRHHLLIGRYEFCSSRGGDHSGMPVAAENKTHVIDTFFAKWVDGRRCNYGG